jgi:hypothetical protein
LVAATLHGSPGCCDFLSKVTAIAKRLQMFDEKRLNEYDEIVLKGLKTVTITFVLFKISVQWPSIKGQRNMQHAASELKKELEASGFKHAWATLPQSIKARISSFGADA